MCYSAIEVFMCRYALSGPYKPHYACFACRKSFKRRLKADVDPDGPDVPARCPQCGVLMADMGLDFAPPPMNDERAWRILGELWTIGATFHSCGCGGPGYRPNSPAAYREFLRAIRSDYAANLAHWEGRRRAQTSSTTPARADLSAETDRAIQLWRVRLAAVDDALQLGT